MKGGPREFCVVDGCERPRVGWGLCGLHYERNRRTGSYAESALAVARRAVPQLDGTKQCFQCGERKPFTTEYFPPAKDRKAKLKGTCRACCAKAVKWSSLKKYGIDQRGYETLLAQQGCACALCGAPLAGGSQAYSPHVDHCHRTGRVRALLCHHCNVMLGHAKESPTLLRRAADYLENDSAIQD